MKPEEEEIVRWKVLESRRDLNFVLDVLLGRNGGLE